MLSVVIDFNLCDSRILELLVPRASAGVVIFLVVRRVEGRDNQAQAGTCWDPPRNPVEVKGNLHDLARA